MNFRDLLQTRSLRFWIAAGMAIALAPVVIAAVIGFVVLNTGVIASFQDVAHRQQSEIIPAQRIASAVWDTALSVDEFVISGNPTHQAAFRASRTDIERSFVGLIATLTDDVVARELASQAHEHWKETSALGEELTSVLRPADAPATIELMERFDGRVRAISDTLSSVIEQLERDISTDQAEARIAYERALWLAGIGAGVCLLAVIFGIVLIGRVMVASVDRLVDGATRFAEGDRAHRIDIRVPPELRRVANEFNRMIGKINAYEAALSDKALKDVLTGLPNRRAFEEAAPEQWERAARNGEPLALLHIDVDHFKRINDTHGHAVGDEVLRWVAATLSQQGRSSHQAFRTGGEEFVVLVPNAGVAEAAAVGERLRAAVAAAPFEMAGIRIEVTVSIGAADSRGVDSPTQLVEVADARLYEAKMQGRNRVVATGADKPA